MKKIIIPFLIIINVLTIYFFVFPYQSYSDYNSLREVNRALSIQANLIESGREKIADDLQKNVKLYPRLKPNEDFVNRNHGIFRDIENNLETLEEAVYEQLFKYYDASEFHDEQPNVFLFRVQPFHYQVPRKALFTNQRLAEAITNIDDNQTAILNEITDETLKQTLVDSFLIDTKTLPQLLKGKSLMQTFAIISKLKNQIAMADYELANQTLENTKSKIAVNQLQLKQFVPIISARKTTIKKGETFEAEIFTTPIMTHDSLNFFINDELVPSKDGIATYQFTPKSKQTKLFNVRIEYHNSLYKDNKDRYKKQFEIDVVDCE